MGIYLVPQIYENPGYFTIPIKYMGIMSPDASLPFPLIPENTQQSIKQKIKAAYDAKAQSRRLIDITKRGFEIAIEKRENEATGWIEMEAEKIWEKYGE